MTELSTTEAKIEQAAKKHAEGTCTGKKYDSTTDLIVPKIKEWAAYDFTAGASFATTSPDILREILKPFLEWVDTNYCNHGVAIDKWSGRKLKQWLKEKNISGAELLEKYIQHLQTNKQKEDLDKG